MFSIFRRVNSGRVCVLGGVLVISLMILFWIWMIVWMYAVL